MVQVGFPVLNESFLTSQGQSYTAFLSYYEGVAQAVKAAGMKLIVENDTLLVNSVSGDWDVAPFYATLNWTGYQQARAQMAAVIAQKMKPDYLVVMEEPDLEAANSGQTNLLIPIDAAAMLSQMLATVHQTGAPNVQLGAGVGSWQQNALEFILGYVLLPVDFIDMHIYPVNDMPGGDYLPLALQIASAAATAGKPVSMTECWLWKVNNTELWVKTGDEIRARDPFSFWAPLDALFVQTMQNLANHTKMVFMDPFNAQAYFAYLPYDDATKNLAPGPILNEEDAAANTANQEAQYTSTGMSYYNSIVVPPDTIPPSAPSGLSGASGNPTTAYISWNAATDNVGVAGYNVLRDNDKAATTASLNYQDSGLTAGTTYTYAIQAFDLAGNLSALSAPIEIQTRDTTPPPVPKHVVAQAVACTKANLTWSPSTDKVGVTWYLIFMGLSANSLNQIATVNSSITSFSDYQLSGGTTYYFGVEAQDKDLNVSSMSPVAQVTTPALPGAPTDVAATADSSTEIGLTWSASTGGLPIAHYMVYRGPSRTNLSQVAITTNTSYTDRSVSPSTKYYYAVQAADTGTPPAQSGLSKVVSATTP
jgi:chitodextrinase